MPKIVPIIIPTYNNVEVLKNCVSSIAAYTMSPHKIVLVNNGSDEFKDEGSNLDILNIKRNLGWTGGITAGLEHVTKNYPDSDYVVFMNDDTEIIPNDNQWLEKMTNIMDNDPDVAAVGPSSNYVMGLQATHIKNPIHALDVKYLIGFCVVMRRKAFEEVGGMDETLPGGDDFDWSIKLRKKGYKLVVARNSFVMHYGCVTGKKVLGTYWGSPQMQKDVDDALIKKHGSLVLKDTINTGTIGLVPYKKEIKIVNEHKTSDKSSVVHIIMPFYRKHLLEKLTNTLESLNVIWHPVCDPIDMQAFENNTRKWIQPVLCEPLKPGQQCYRKVNDFIDTGNIVNEDYYLFMHDDDMYTPGFLDKVKKQTAKIIFFSMERGDVVPKDEHFPWPAIPILFNSINDVRVYNIDLCQMCVKGEILKQTRFGITQNHDDGLYAENLKARWPSDILVLPEIGIMFNYLQPGRYINR